MPLKKQKPRTPGMRFTTVSTFEEITTGKPERSLVKGRKGKGGRNANGRVTVRHRGGGHKRRLRDVDFKREKTGIPAKVVSIEYDPNRSANIALVSYADGEKRYMLAPQGLKAGQEVISGNDVEPSAGNTLPLGRIPPGMAIHNIELEPGKGGRMVRSAGLGARILSREGGFAHVKLPSGEIRMINVKCMATIGRLGNVEHDSDVKGKAGRRRWQGVRPTVRGVAMNPVDHPMGGGEGRSSGGGHPVSPWGKLAKSGRTRRKRKPSNKFIVKRRK
ncbi:MAG: 50S ribosomal protein L2 [Kiritimatiellia bacterium]